MMPINTEPPPDPTASTAPAGAVLPLSDEQVKNWRQELAQSEAQLKTLEPWMEACVKDYWDGASQPDVYRDQIHTLRPFTLVERKKADLFYQRPDVTQVPSPLMDGPILLPTGQPMTGPPNPQTGQPGAPILQTVALEANEEIVNELLGPDGIDAKHLAHQVLFDILCSAGTGWTKLGYESATIDQPHPLDQTKTISVPVYERCYWEYIPPKQTRRPAKLRSTDWDRAPWLGFRFELPLTPANRVKYRLPEDFQGSSQSTTQHFDHGLEQASGQKVFTGTEVWYRSCLYREDIVHPEHFTQLVLVDGRDDPAIHQNSPHQTLDAQGQLTPNSLLGNPIHPGNLRILTDSAYPPSDCMVMRPLVRELDLFREQMVQMRDAMTLRWQYNVDTLPPDALDKIVRSPIGGMIGLPGEAYVGEGAIKELPMGTFPRASFESNEVIDNDLARATAVDATGSGVNSLGTKTATETQVVQSNANARFDFERAVFLDWYVKGVTKFATLVMRWLPVKQAAEIVGPVKAPIWDVWRQTAKATCSWTALPDSALRTDLATDRKSTLDFYSFVANDPYCQSARPKILEKLFRKHHIDPAGLIVPPTPPKPEPPKVNLSFTGQDVVGPQGPIVLEILAQLGVTVNPATVQLAMAAQQQSLQMAAQADAQKATAAAGDPHHGGKVAPMESLSKHSADTTGGMQGTGHAAPIAPGGSVM